MFMLTRFSKINLNPSRYTGIITLMNIIEKKYHGKLYIDFHTQISLLQDFFLHWNLALRNVYQFIGDNVYEQKVCTLQVLQ